MVTTMIKFTKIEWDIIYDRLLCDDCLIEVFTESDPTLDFDVLQDAINTLTRKGYKGVVFEDCTKLEKEIIVECCEGGVFFGNLKYGESTAELSTQKVIAYFRAADSLGDKLGIAVTTW